MTVDVGLRVTDWDGRDWVVVGVAEQAEVRWPWGEDRAIVLRRDDGAEMASGWASDIGTDLGLPWSTSATWAMSSAASVQIVPDPEWQHPVMTGLADA